MRKKRGLACAVVSMACVTSFASPARADEPVDVKLPPAAPPPSGPAPAEPQPATSTPEPQEAWHVAAGIGTDFPMALGARAHVEAPWRMRASLSVGFLPRAYVSAINAFLIGIHAYSDATGDLIKDSVGNSLIWRLHLGYRPFEKLGLYGELGYGFVGLGGSASTAELIAGITGQPLPERANALAGRFEFGCKSVLHMFDIEIGYDIPIADRFQLRVAIGAGLTFASKTTLDAKFIGKDPAILRKLESLAANYLDDVYTSYVFTPVLSVSGSYLFL